MTGSQPAQPTASVTFFVAVQESFQRVSACRAWHDCCPCRIYDPLGCSHRVRFGDERSL